MDTPTAAQRKAQLADYTLINETYTPEKLEEYAKQLAHTFKVAPNELADKKFLEQHLTDAENIIKNANTKFYKSISEEDDDIPSPVSSEWILDNYYLIEQQVRRLKDDWKPGVYKNLPILASNLNYGQPRIYALSAELLNHTNNVVEEETIINYLNTFQKISPLSTLEIWNIPFMLKLVLIENISSIVQADLNRLNKHQNEKTITTKLLKKSG